MEEILSRAMKAAEAAEVFMVTTEETPVQFEANRLKHIHSGESRHVALRIIRQGRIGYAVTTNLDDRQQLVDAAVATAEFGMEAGFSFLGPTPYPNVVTHDPAVSAVSLDAMVKLGAELVEAARGHTPEIMCDAEVSKESASLRLINSAGAEVSYQQTEFGLSLQGQLIRGTDMLFVGDGEDSCRPITDIKDVSQRVIRQLEMARETAELPSRPLPVIFTPNGIASALITPLMSAFNGKVVLEGASPLGDKVGETVFDTKLNLHDDPTLDYRPHSRPADSEGTPSQRTPLIENGVVKGFLYDRLTAARAQTESTGNGSRGGGMPQPAPSAFIITPGTTSFEEMLADIKEGLLVEYVMGASQGNILSGDFSGNVLLGYKIENGKIVGRVKDKMVAGNVYKILKDLSALGSDGRWVGDTVYTPSLYCPELSVASR